MKREITDTPFPIKLWADSVEPDAERQLRNIASLPFLFSHIAVMPDVHLGKGSTIGAVIATKGAVLPAAVGVDIGCGMSALRLPIKIHQLQNLAALRSSIERSIPLGHESNKSSTTRMEKKMAELRITPSLVQESTLAKKALLQLGSLGSGNHFIEVCYDQNQDLWIMLHSGSRQVGLKLAEMHINAAKGQMRDRWEKLPDPDLAFLTESTPEFLAYINDMLWAQNYARANRREMVKRILKDVSHHLYQDPRLCDLDEKTFFIDCHHNYCQREKHFGQEVWLTRKGAVSAQTGQYGIIPGSMGAGSFIVRGKGNAASFFSCAHGAGRKMSRAKARKIFTREDLERETQNIECRKDRAVLDEIPSAYKDINQVMELQADLVSIEFQLKQLICIKGG